MGLKVYAMQTSPTPSFAPENSEQWRIGILIGGNALNAAAWSLVDASEPATARVPLPDGNLKTLEEAVYSVPGLLADFKRVDLLWRTSSFTVVPSALTETAARHAATLTGIWSDDGDSVLHRSPMVAVEADVLWSMPAEISHFLARTFRNPRFHHPLAVLGRAFAGCSNRGNCAKLFVHVGPDDTLDIGCFDSAGRLLALTTRHTPTDADALYYILGIFQAYGFDVETDQILMCGAMYRRQALTPLLRRYVRKVLPLILSPETSTSSMPQLLSLTAQYT